MAAHGLALIAAIVAVQDSSIPASRAPGIWSPPKSTPAPSQSLAPTVPNCAEIGGLTVSIRREIRAALRSGQLSPAQARVFRRDLATIDGWSWGDLSSAQRVQVVSSLEALSSLIYAATGIITVK